MTANLARPAPAFAAGPDGAFSPLSLAAQARALAAEVLVGLPDRLAHSLLAGRQARRVSRTVPEHARDLLEAAATVHDIGYARELHDTGFHPVDGARYLMRAGAPYRLAALVAHHSEARLIAAARGLVPALSAFEHEDSVLSDALTYADMTAGPTGTVMTVEERLADIAERHAFELPSLHAARRAREPLLLAAHRRVTHRLDGVRTTS